MDIDMFKNCVKEKNRVDMEYASIPFTEGYNDLDVKWIKEVGLKNVISFYSNDFGDSIPSSYAKSMKIITSVDKSKESQNSSEMLARAFGATNYITGEKMEMDWDSKEEKDILSYILVKESSAWGYPKDKEQVHRWMSKLADMGILDKNKIIALGYSCTPVARNLEKIVRSY